MPRTVLTTFLIAFVITLSSPLISSAQENSLGDERVLTAERDKGMSCIELEQEITELSPKTYSKLPDFYEDPMRGAAIMVGTTIVPLAYVGLAYPEFLAYEERAVIVSAEQRIERLRHLKAQKHCFET